MELFKIQATGLKAIGLLVVALGVWVILSGPRFSRMCGDLDEVAKTITFDITTREMRRLASDAHGKSWVEMKAQFDMAQRTNQLHVIITDLKCADTFLMGSCAGRIITSARMTTPAPTGRTSSACAAAENRSPGSTTWGREKCSSTSHRGSA